MQILPLSMMSTFENNSPRTAYVKRRKRAIEHQRSAPKIDAVPSEIRVQKILVPVDFSKTSMRAVRYAVTLASQCGAEIILLHIIGAATFAKESSHLGFAEIGAAGGRKGASESLRSRPSRLA